MWAIKAMEHAEVYFNVSITYKSAQINEELKEILHSRFCAQLTQSF